MLNVGLDEETNADGDRRAPSATRRSSPRSAATRTTADRLRRRARRRRSPALGRAREGAGDRRDRARLLPRHRRAGRAAARLRGPDRDRPRARPADRDPRPRPGGRERRRSTRSSPSSTPRAGGVAGDPPLLLGPAAGRGRGRARLVLLVRRQRHLPERPTRCARRPRRCPTSCSWSRPTPPTWRRSRCAASRNEPANVVATARGRSPRSAASPTRSWSATVEANARALFGW